MSPTASEGERHTSGAGNGPRVLVLTTVLPRRRRLGGEIASQALIDALALTARLIVIGYDRRDESQPPEPWERRAARRWVETADAPRHVTTGWMLKSIMLRQPYSVAKYTSARYLGMTLRRLAAVDLVVVDHAQSAWTMPFLGAVPKIYVAHNLESSAYGSLARAAATAIGRWQYTREERMIGHVENRATAIADVVWALTVQDAESLRRSVPAADVRILGLPAPTVPDLAAEPVCSDVALLGTWTWGPNQIGLHWFLSEVVPLLASDLRIRIAGTVAEETRKLATAIAGHDIQIVGRVPDATAFVRGARVVAIPTRAGTGVQVKALAAMSAGVRIVSTNMGVRGIDEAPWYVEIADEPAQFAAALQRAVASGGDRQRLQLQGREWAHHRRKVFERHVAESVRHLTGADTIESRL